MIHSILLAVVQAAGAVADTAKTGITTPVEAPKVDSLSLLDLVMKGGYIMIPIGILSLLTIYFFIERLLAVKKASRIDSNFLNNIRDTISHGNMESAKMLCKSASNPMARMIEKGISKIGRPVKDIESSMESVGKIEVAKLERNIGALSVIAGIAPMFGFVGTIAGVIRIFYNISLSNDMSIGIIAGGLYEKMITSAAGLIVGIIAFISFHYLRSQIDKLVTRMEVGALDFIELLEQPTR